MQGAFTPQAKKIWESYTEDVQAWLLNNTWCSQCRDLSSMDNVSGKIESGLLMLRGRCTRCGGNVVRVTGTPRGRFLFYKFLVNRKIKDLLEVYNPKFP
jgi:hypothetical protein